jgi:branched-chain amino acid transport system substrate-binding protein
MTDPQSVLDSEGDAALGIRTTANWAPTLKNKENVLFLKQFDKFGIGEPSAFAELGYVAAQFLDLALRKVHGDTSNKPRLLKAMASVGTWLSPGGKLTMDTNTQNVIEPVYLRTVVKTGSGYTQPLVSTLGIFKEPGA